MANTVDHAEHDVELKGVTKRFRSFVAVREVSLIVGCPLGSGLTICAKARDYLGPRPP